MGSPEKPIDVEMGDMEESSQLNPQSDVKTGEKAEESEERFTGLKKDELLEISNQRQWVIARWILFIVFWAAWIGMLVGAIIIVVQAPKCKEEPSPPWYQDTIVYQADVRKFADGLGGMKEHLDYVRSLNSKTLTVCHANDPDDLSRVVGDDAAAFTALVESSHGENKDEHIRVVVDLRIDALSTSGPEFVKSAEAECAGASPTGENCDLFQWKTNDSVPTAGSENWVYHPQRGENYKSGDGVAFVNYKSSSGTKYLTSIIRKWINDYKVDGFQLRDVSTIGTRTDIMEVVGVVQNTINETQLALEEDDRKVIGLYLLSSKESVQGDLFPDGNDTDSAAVTINSGLSKATTAAQMREVIEKWRDATEPFIGAYTINTMEQSPLATRVGGNITAGLTLLEYALPGVPVIKSGDEALLDSDQIIWDTTVKVQVPVNASTDNINVISQVADLRVNQHRALRSLRWDNVDAKFEFRETNSSDVLAFTRKWDQKPTILVLHNPTVEEVAVSVTKKDKEDKMEVILASDPSIEEKTKYSFDVVALPSGLTLLLEIKMK